MACHTELGMSRGRREWHIQRSRPCAGAPHHVAEARSPLPLSTTSDRDDPQWVSALVQAADLVTRIAVIVPTPSAALCVDDHAWLAFNDFLDEAAGLVADALGATAAPTLRVLLGSLVGTDAVAWLLMERVLDVLGREGRG